MNTEWRNFDADLSVLGSYKQIVRDGRRIATASCVSLFPAGNPLKVPSSICFTLQKVAILIPKAEGKDTFDDLTDGLVSEERPTSKIRPGKSVSTVMLNSTVRDYIASIPDLVNDEVVQIFSNAGQATQSNPTNVVLQRNFHCF